MQLAAEKQVGMGFLGANLHHQSLSKSCSEVSSSARQVVGAPQP